MTVGSIGNVNSDEKLIPIGIIGTIKSPIIIVLMLIKIPSVPLANVKIANIITVKQPKQLSLIINLKFFRRYIIAPEENEAPNPNRIVTPQTSDTSPV